MGFLNDLKSLFTDDFKNGVEQQTSKYPIVYIDPNKFDKKYYTDHGSVNPDDVEKMREMLDSQMPGFSKNHTDQDIKELVEASILRGPFAGHIKNDGKDICIVNTIDNDIKDKQTLAALLSDTAHEKLKHVPGWQDHWERIVGIHEGEHCNQDDSRTYLQVLARETGSDQETLNWLKENKLDDIARAFADYRAMAAKSGEVQHSTSIFLNINGENPDGLSKIKAAASFKEEMLLEVMLEKDISYDDAQKLMNDDPTEFAKTIADNLKQGAFKRDNPYIEKFVKDYVEGIQRNGFPIDAEKNIETAIRNMDAEMMFEVMEVHGIDYAQAMKMRGDDPEKFAKTIENGLKNGHFDRKDNPYIKEYISSYADGFRRQIIEAKPAPEPKEDPRASLDNTDDTTQYAQAEAPNKTEVAAETVAVAAVATPSAYANMDVSTISDGQKLEVNQSHIVNTSTKIGGVSVPAYFASFADPGLATARLEQQKTVEPPPLVLTSTQQYQYTS